MLKYYGVGNDRMVWLGAHTTAEGKAGEGGGYDRGVQTQGIETLEHSLCIHETPRPPLPRFHKSVVAGGLTVRLPPATHRNRSVHFVLPNSTASSLAVWPHRMKKIPFASSRDKASSSWRWCKHRVGITLAHHHLQSVPPGGCKTLPAVSTDHYCFTML